MGNNSSAPGNMFATGHTMYINEKGETVTDTIHHYNGETVRSTETGQLPTTGGGFISQSFYTPWVPLVLAATVFFLISTIMFAMMKQRLDKEKAMKERRSLSTVEDTLHSIPLYSLKKPKSHRPASKIDLLDEIDLEA